MSCSLGGLGRGRGRRRIDPISPPDYIEFSPSSTPTNDDLISLSEQHSTANTDESESGVSSLSDSIEHLCKSKTNILHCRGRGRGSARIPQKESTLIDPHWMVTSLTHLQFYSSERQKYPDELGTLGERIRVIANYFPILQFPNRGLVYKYQIQIRNRKQLEIHRERRRVLYNLWLRGLYQRFPKIDKYKIVFDNQSRILTFDQPLPDIYDTENIEVVMGPNRSNKQEPHTVIVQRVGTPVDLALIQNLDLFFDRNNLLNERKENLEDVKQVLSIALHEHCSSHAAFVYNRSFFSPTFEGRHGEWDLGNGKALWRGFYSCLVFGKGRYQLLMNIDVRHTIFLKKQPFLEFICEILLHSPSGKREYSRQRNVTKINGNDALRYLDVKSPTYQADADFLLKQCKNMRVRSQDANKPVIYQIVNFGLPASKQEFQWKTKGGCMITVVDYYKEHYNLDLKYPSLPVLEMHNRSFIPMELVDVEPARVEKITDEQRALLRRYSSMKPEDYWRSVKNIRTDPQQQRFEDDPFVRAWNLNVDVNMVTIPARILPMPEIIYTDRYRVMKSNVRELGRWELPKTTQFYKPNSFPTVWAMINLTSLSEDTCFELYHELSYLAQQRGMNCPQPAIYEQLNAEVYSVEQLINTIEDILSQNNDCQLLLVILPSNSQSRSQIYGHIKKLCEFEYASFGIVSQMIREKNSFVGTRRDRGKWDYATLSTILMKINTKLNGINSTLKVPDTIERFFSRGHRIMYVGIDLSHSSSTSLIETSMVAVVASADDIPNRYFKEVYKQTRLSRSRTESRECIVSMKEIMRSLIQQYERHRGFPPTAIVIYRDGISEGEFNTVFEKELMATREACTDLSPVYRPYLTYIVVSKRHHTRFFPTNSDKNVPAGTIVDSPDITNPSTYDFYLNSHFGVAGTSRPTHYYVLYDDNNLKPDEMQLLTYALCYAYAPCTRSISIPAPVKYADLLAFRATYYFDHTDRSDSDCNGSSSNLSMEGSIDSSGKTVSERIVVNSKIDPGCLFFI